MLGYIDKKILISNKWIKRKSKTKTEINWLIGLKIVNDSY